MTPPDTEKSVFQYTPLALIDDPALPAREQMTDEGMADLVASIAELGLLQPVGLKRNGERFEVVYGHRRTLACRELKEEFIPSLILPANFKRQEAAKLHENIRREELNAGEEAVYFMQLLELIEPPDTDVLARDLKVTRDYVETRLVLLRGDEYVLKALKANEISLAVAQELNRVKEQPARLDFLRYAIVQGASARVVKNWRSAHETMRELNPQQIVDRDEEHHSHVHTPSNPFSCLLCANDQDPQTLLFVQIHRHCLRILESQAGINIVGIFAAPQPATPPPPPGDKDA